MHYETTSRRLCAYRLYVVLTFRKKNENIKKTLFLGHFTLFNTYLKEQCLSVRPPACLSVSLPVCPSVCDVSL